MRKAERPSNDLLSDEELHDRVMSKPEVLGRIKEALRKARRADGEPGIAAEELPEFLREHG